MDSKGRDAKSPWQMPLAAWRAVAIRTWREASDDNIGLVAAGVAFYGFLALVPLLTAIVLCYGIFADSATVIEHVRALTSLVPHDVAAMIGEQLLELVRTSDGKKGLGVLIALAIAIFGARNGAGAIITALNIAYEETEKRGFLRLNLTAIAMTLAAVIAASVAVVAVAALSALAKLMEMGDGAIGVIGTGLTYLLLTGSGACGAAALYRFAPSRNSARWTWITPGSLMSALLWLFLTLGFGAYVANFAHYDESYGALGAVVALLTWLYLSSYVLLFGAELNSELEHQTAEDTTAGAPKPMGSRAAWVADHVADASPEENSAATSAREPAAPETPAPRPAPPPQEATARGGFVVSRLSLRAGRVVGLPKIGWAASAMASLGLSMLRRRRQRAAGAALVATAAGISLLIRKD